MDNMQTTRVKDDNFFKEILPYRMCSCIPNLLQTYINLNVLIQLPEKYKAIYYKIYLDKLEMMCCNKKSQGVLHNNLVVYKCKHKAKQIYVRELTNKIGVFLQHLLDNPNKILFEEKEKKQKIPSKYYRL